MDTGTVSASARSLAGGHNLWYLSSLALAHMAAVLCGLCPLPSIASVLTIIGAYSSSLLLNCFHILWLLYLLPAGCSTQAGLEGHFESIASSTDTECLSSLCPRQTWHPCLLAPVAGDVSQGVRCVYNQCWPSAR